MKLTGKTSLCRCCGKVFTTVSTFDKHRVGKYDIAAPHYGRRCLTSEELEAKGYGINKRGRWFRSWMGPARAYVMQGEAITPEPVQG